MLKARVRCSYMLRPQEWKKEASFTPRIRKLATSCLKRAPDGSAEKAIHLAEAFMARVKGHKPSTTAPVLHESYAAAADAKRATEEKGEAESENLQSQDAAANARDMTQVLSDGRRLIATAMDSLSTTTNKVRAIKEGAQQGAINMWSRAEQGGADAIQRAQVVQELLEAQLAPDVLNSEKKFLKQIQSQYGDRFAFLFAFMQAITRALLLLQFFMVVHFLLLWPLVETTYGVPFWDFSENYSRRASGVFGLLVPCVWCPIFLGIWDRHSQQLRREWGVVGATEMPILSPFYRKLRDGKCTRRLKQVGFHCAIALSVGVLFVITFLQLEYELITLITPICVSPMQRVSAVGYGNLSVPLLCSAELVFFQQSLGAIHCIRCYQRQRQLAGVSKLLPRLPGYWSNRRLARPVVHNPRHHRGYCHRNCCCIVPATGGMDGQAGKHANLARTRAQARRHYLPA